MMNGNRSLVAPTANALLERALHDKLARRREACGPMGELEPLAVRLGLMQNTLKPRFREPRLLVFAADHGLAVEGLGAPGARHSQDEVALLLQGRHALPVFARAHQLEMTVVDCGVAVDLPGHERLLARKIAHGTRNARVHAAMSVDQAHAAMRAGMEIGEALRGNVLLCAGLGLGRDESAALLLARLSGRPLHDFLGDDPALPPARRAHVEAVLLAALARHQHLVDPVEVLAAFGGFEVAVMAGVMLVAASKRDLLMVDGMAACAALLLAQRIAPAVTDYCVFCRSHGRAGLDQAMGLFRASALLELGLGTGDGTGAVLAWPLVRSAGALLTEVQDGDETVSSRPGLLDEGLLPTAMAMAAADGWPADSAGSAAAGVGAAAGPSAAAPDARVPGMAEAAAGALADANAGAQADAHATLDDPAPLAPQRIYWAQSLPPQTRP